MLHCGLLGRKLGHSYSPAIHNLFDNYEYRLFEKEEEDIESFIKDSDWNGINVTIPYKKTVIPFLDSISDTAREIYSVNTIIRSADGKLFGDNTDVFGFTELVRHSGIKADGKKALILGSGGSSASVMYALKKLGAVPVIISRSGENNYENLHLHSDADIIVNTTPLGMFPKTGVAPLDLRLFPNCSGVIDIIYNPARTALLLQAEELGIPNENGLYMLVSQAKKSSELFSGKTIPDSETERVYRELDRSMKNIVLIGMPGSGKSTVAKKLQELTGRTVLDSDTEIEKKTGLSPKQIIIEQGEPAFRDIESEVIAELGKLSGSVIATGGGAILRDENYTFLHQNGTIVWVRRDIHALDNKDRPISQKVSADELYRKREPRYKKFADVIVDIDTDADVSARMVLNAIK